MYSKMNQVYIYIYPLCFRLLSHLGHCRVAFPVLYNRSLLVVCLCQSKSPNLLLSLYPLVTISLFSMHSRLPRGVRPRLEGKPRTPLSSRVATRISWSPLSGLNGVQPALQFGERTRDWSAGHAGK